MVDIFDTNFEEVDIDLQANFVQMGEEINLKEKDPTLRKIVLGAGWDGFSYNSDALDLDLSLLLLDKDRMTRVDEDFIFYNQPEAINGGIRHRGDNRTGAGDGDDETISVFLEAIPFDVFHAYIVMSIYQGYEKEQNLSMVRNSYIRLYNEENQDELIRFKMDGELKGQMETAVVVAALNREGPKWHFKPMMEYYMGGLTEIAKKYGMIVKEQ